MPNVIKQRNELNRKILQSKMFGNSGLQGGKQIAVHKNFRIWLELGLKLLAIFAFSTFDVSFLCQLRLEKLKSSARHEKNWSAGVSMYQIQVFNLQALILAGIISMLALARTLTSAYRRSPFITSKKTTYSNENKYILQILACPDQIPPSSTGSAVAIA